MLYPEQAVISGKKNLKFQRCFVKASLKAQYFNRKI